MSNFSFASDLISTAMKADEIFSEALAEQFGEDASRWDHKPSEYNGVTRAARELKRAADNAMHTVFEATQAQQGVTVTPHH